MPFMDDVRKASQSYTFQQMLRLNPRLARAAARDRDRLAVAFVRAQGLENGSPLYAAAVLNGYDPTAPAGFVPGID